MKENTELEKSTTIKPFLKKNLRYNFSLNPIQEGGDKKAPLPVFPLQLLQT